MKEYRSTGKAKGSAPATRDSKLRRGQDSLRSFSKAGERTTGSPRPAYPKWAKSIASLQSKKLTLEKVIGGYPVLETKEGLAGEARKARAAA